MIKYIIPFYYTYHSRSKGIHFVSYLIMVILPQFLLCFFYKQAEPIFKFVFDFFIAFVGMLSIYEAGYIVNDSICIKKDPHPSKRIEIEEQKYVEKNIVSILTFKILLSLVCVLFFVFTYGGEKSIFYICSLCILLVTYIVHNAARSFVNFITVFILTTFNYLSTVLILCRQEYFLRCFFLVVCSFSIPKTFFYIRRKCAEKKDKFWFALFYLIETVVFCLLIWFTNFDFRLFYIPFSQFIWRFLTSFLKDRKEKAE